MDELTQRNSALAEENAATAKTLERQSMTMSEQVAFFRIDESSVAAVAENDAAPAPRGAGARARAAVAAARR